MQLKSVIIAAAAVVIFPCVAQASTITRTYTFDAIFSSLNNFDVNGSFTTTFDPSANGGGSLDSFSFSLPGSFLPAIFYNSQGILTIGNNCDGFGSCAVARGNDQFALQLAVDASGVNPDGIVFNYASKSGDLASADSLSVAAVDPTPVPSPVPLPASAPLFGAALLAFAGLSRTLMRAKLAA